MRHYQGGWGNVVALPGNAGPLFFCFRRILVVLFVPVGWHRGIYSTVWIRDFRTASAPLFSTPQALPLESEDNVSICIATKCH